MQNELEKIPVVIKSNCTPAEFYVEFKNQQTNLEYCAVLKQTADWNAIGNNHAAPDGAAPKQSLVLKCHLAFIAPVSYYWSHTSIDKFNEYAQKYTALAITIPSVVNSATESTGVILWGFVDRKVNASEANIDGWQNINLQMIFQGVARTIVDIDSFDYRSKRETNYDEQLFEKKTRPAGQTDELFSIQVFIGTPVSIEAGLTIYVQTLEHKQHVLRMSQQMATIWNANPTNKFYKRDLCTANRDNRYFYRVQVKKVFRERQSCVVHFIDFHCDGEVLFKNLSKKIMFRKDPAQFRKCRLLNVIHPTQVQMKQSVQFANDSILNRNCTILIHDNLDPSQSDSIICTIRSWGSDTDLASSLISHGLAKKAYNYVRDHIEPQNDQANRPRHIRRDCDDVVLKMSSDLKTFDDFVAFYDKHKAVIPPIVRQTDSLEELRQFDAFDIPHKLKPINKKMLNVNPEAHSNVSKPHLMLQHIEKYFKPLRYSAPVFECKPLCVIDPVTILIVPNNVMPPEIEAPPRQHYSGILPDFSPCIVFLDNKWHRGIVWSRTSTNKYHILFIDTMQILETARNHIRQCPKELLHTKVQFIKVRLSQIQPISYLRPLDACAQLTKLLLEKKRLCAKVIRVPADGTPEVDLFMPNDPNKHIFSDLIKEKFYTKIKVRSAAS